MTVEVLARELGLWNQIQHVISFCAGSDSVRLLSGLALLPIKRSRATRCLGSYVSRQGQPVCIRLQFAQEAKSLGQTLLHEIAHFCDHQTNQIGRSYRRAHGAQWQYWAQAFGISVRSCGQSEALDQLHQQRLKLVAICQRCGTEFQRVRALNRRRRYLHAGCGGRLRPF